MTASTCFRGRASGLPPAPIAAIIILTIFSGSVIKELMFRHDGSDTFVSQNYMPLGEYDVFGEVTPFYPDNRN